MLEWILAILFVLIFIYLFTHLRDVGEGLDISFKNDKSGWWNPIPQPEPPQEKNPEPDPEPSNIFLPNDPEDPISQN